MCDRLSIQCIIPPYINDKLAQSTNPTVRARAIANIRAAATLRTQRVMSQAMPGLMASAAPTKKKQRLVYDAKKGDQLPGKLVRSEGQPKVADVAVNQAYDYSGNTYDFYDQLFGRNSLDNNGMTLISSVHVGEVDENGTLVPMNNAFWNGEQMAYGDGDGVIFRDFTGSLDVVGHELTHGVESFTSNLEYRNQSGALNEHFADVFGVLVRQWINGETALKANWLIGAEVLVPAPTRRAIRDMENPGTAFVNDPDLGDDPQPGHMRRSLHRFRRSWRRPHQLRHSQSRVRARRQGAQGQRLECGRPHLVRHDASADDDEPDCRLREGLTPGREHAEIRRRREEGCEVGVEKGGHQPLISSTFRGPLCVSSSLSPVALSARSVSARSIPHRWTRTRPRRSKRW